MIYLNKDNFKAETEISNTLIVVDFWAEWCGPCKMLAPVFEKLSEEMTDVKFCKVNVDENPELCDEFKVSSIPTLLFIKNDVLEDISVGYMTEDQLRQKIEENK